MRVRGNDAKVSHHGQTPASGMSGGQFRTFAGCRHWAILAGGCNPQPAVPSVAAPAALRLGHHRAVIRAPRLRRLAQRRRVEDRGGLAVVPALPPTAGGVREPDHETDVRLRLFLRAAEVSHTSQPWSRLWGMEFLCYHRDRPGSVALRDELLEEHWSYMDRYAKEMIARGPTLAGDGETPTGSVHIVDLSDPAAARAFAFDEPNYQAGVYRDVLLRRWRNTLGRTMWDFHGGRTGGNRYLVLGLGTGQAADLAAPPDSDELIAYGPLLSDNGVTWLGTAVLLRAPGPDEARAVLTPYRYADIEVHNWQFGGRP
jgi:uncharacterized protein